MARGPQGARPPLLTEVRVASSTGSREAERFGTPPRRASSVTRAAKEENSGGLKYKAGRVSDEVHPGPVSRDRPLPVGAQLAHEGRRRASSQGHLGDSSGASTMGPE